MGADPLAHAGQQVADGLRRREDVERRRQRALVVKVAQPEFGPGELPLLVLVVLRREGQKREEEVCEKELHGRRWRPLRRSA